MRHRHAVRRLAATLISLAVGFGGVSLAATPAAAYAPPVVNKQVFNNPTGSADQQNAVYNQLLSLIESARQYKEQNPGTTVQIRGAVKELGDQAIANELLTAAEKGVQVKLLVDHSSASSGAGYTNLRNNLASKNAASWIEVCNSAGPAARGCFSSRKYGESVAYQHNKYWTFSHIQGNTGVVMQTSSNFPDSGWYKTETWNDSATVADTGTYNDFVSQFTRMNSARTKTQPATDATAYYDNYHAETSSTSDRYSMYFFPRKEASGESFTGGTQTDTVLDLLKNVKCSYTGPDNKTHQTLIRVAMWSFTRTAVAGRLVALRKAGCWVDVVYNKTEQDSGYGLDVLKILRTTDIQLAECDQAVAGEKRVHSKFMLIDGDTGSGYARRVYTGSHNYAISALRLADETILGIKDPGTSYTSDTDGFHGVAGDATGGQYLDQFYAARANCGIVGGA
ncbi:phospholipase D-like domain-containing protein [Streptomyces sp. T-3]|nr:phospholipase D-like domain-containing protein [Streptomyces sp. T-3]